VQARWAARPALNVPSGVLRSNESLTFVLSANLPNTGRVDIHVVSLLLKASLSGR
jgi:hypothetical protein